MRATDALELVDAGCRHGLPIEDVLDEVCADVAQSDTAMRQRVAAKLREAAQAATCSIEDLKRAGRDELMRAPTMWR